MFDRSFIADKWQMLLLQRLELFGAGFYSISSSLAIHRLSSSRSDLSNFLANSLCIHLLQAVRWIIWFRLCLHSRTAFKTNDVQIAKLKDTKDDTKESCKWIIQQWAECDRSGTTPTEEGNWPIAMAFLYANGSASDHDVALATRIHKHVGHIECELWSLCIYACILAEPASHKQMAQQMIGIASHMILAVLAKTMAYFTHLDKALRDAVDLLGFHCSSNNDVRCLSPRLSVHGLSKSLMQKLALGFHERVLLDLNLSQSFVQTFDHLYHWIHVYSNLCREDQQLLPTLQCSPSCPQRRWHCLQSWPKRFISTCHTVYQASEQAARNVFEHVELSFNLTEVINRQRRTHWQGGSCNTHAMNTCIYCSQQVIVQVVKLYTTGRCKLTWSLLKWLCRNPKDATGCNGHLKALIIRSEYHHRRRRRLIFVQLQRPKPWLAVTSTSVTVN